ncbi:MAG: hypothetical protein KDC44_23505 [Phaeodactylibacter sp.]|nr:hypothetical protein [Phaeodactylibacter sp.]
MKPIQKYAEDRLSAEEKEQITRQLIRQKFEQDLKQSWAAQLEEKGLLREPLQRSPLLKPGVWLSIAAGLALFLVAFFLLRGLFNPSVEQLAQRHLAELGIMADQLAVRKGSETTDAWKVEANTAYLEGNYEAALSDFQRLVDAGAADGYDRFYLGICYLLKKEQLPGPAIEQLKLAQAQEGDLRQEIDWVLALAYTKNAEYEKAERLLQQIISNKQYMQQQAAELLRALKVKQDQ